MKSTEVQTSPMLASDAQLLACGIYMSVVLNTTNYVIITDVTARLNLEEYIPPTAVLEAYLQVIQ